MATSPRPETLPLRVLQVVRERALWRPGDRVVVAVSGGADSLALLLALHRTRAAHGGALSVVSFDHGLRPASAAEVDAVGRRAADLGLPFEGVAFDLEAGPAVPARARAARRTALRATGADRVALGHHADDQAETVLQRLTRGAGARGLAAMRPRAGIFVRPLIFERRATLEAFLVGAGWRWVEDPSNATSERGKLRRLMPALEAVRPGAAQGLARSARLLAEDAALLDALADGARVRCARDGGLALQALRSEPRPIALRLLLALVEAAGAPARADRVEAVLTETAWGDRVIEVSGGVRLVVRGGVVRAAGPHQSG
jgi:tRNA(Ile)-lysidine synthase